MAALDKRALRKRVKRELGKIRPALKRDGGDVELVSVTAAGVVKVRLLGACRTCPGATMTIKHIVERRLKKAVPKVKRVVRV